MAAAERDYYDVLGVPREADEKTIKQAYHKLAMKWHPDRNKSPDAEEKFKEIAKAYAILKDPKKRAQYDRQGFEGVAHYSAEDLFGGMDFANLFGDMGFSFGGGGIFDRMFGGRATRPSHGQDLQVQIQVPLEIIDKGGKQSVTVNHPTTCPTCHGYGTRSGKPAPLCPECHGSGKKVVTREETRNNQRIQYQQVNVCPACHGRGTEITEPCTTCGGYGQVEKQENIKVTIPPGTEDGMTLRVAGHGLPADEPSAPPGDLHVVVYSQPDSRFQRRGADLWRAESLSLADAVLGTTITVPTLQGSVKVKVPAGTQPDEVLRVKGKGLSRYSRSKADGASDSQRGDLHIRVQVVIPTKLTQKEQQLFEQLRELEKNN